MSPVTAPSMATGSTTAGMSRPRNLSNVTNGQVAGATVTRPKSSGGLSNFTKGSDEEQKTAVKVAIRLRPPLNNNDPNFDLIPARFRKSSCLVPTPTTLSVESSQGKKSFIFDRVFQDAESQENIWEYVSGGVESFLQGYNVSLLAYGQSGAGKSYTMGTSEPGEQSSNSTVGIIPRAAAALFDKLSPSSSKQPNGTGIRMPKRYSGLNGPTDGTAGKKEDKSWQLSVTYVEIYNEQLRDLLVSEQVPSNERAHVTIREDSKGKILLTGLKQLPINSVDDLMNALHFGSSIRQTDSTNINSKSSRSHAVFSLNLVQKKNRSSTGSSVDKRGSSVTDSASGDNTVIVDSKLHFVDLAGSERLKNSGLTGERVKEGISINAGLASLGKVISQLSSRSTGSHVSYRDSRLTRMLQDSLGGNAITYMVACINPVEFHLSETLNTVQYAQRARAIQIRPQIQQRSDDGDKQLIIDRLRSEIKFLREQIRSSQQGDRRKTSGNDRSMRNMDRENELQNQILDIQENYHALSQRHANIVSELSKGKDADVSKLPNLKRALDSSAKDRLSRSKDFSDQMEHVIVEYEKTIQSLESSLSNTRSQLATSEGNLLEREARIVYLEAMTQQLQARLSKTMDKEASRENHLLDLQSELDSASSSEEKQILLMQDMRKELVQMRESESSAEEYISTLEERLAEAEQDTEVMQREISRLEHVVDRQRSVGKLDNLLSELDHLRQDETAQTDGEQRKSYDEQNTDFFHDRLVATASAPHPHEELAPEAADEEWRSFGPMDGEDGVGSESSHDATKAGQMETPPRPDAQVNGEDKVHSPAQAKALADKLETITMELFEVRGDHDSVLVEFDELKRKYQFALSTLAELKDAVSPPQKNHSTPSFLGGVGMAEDSREDGQRSSSRMLSLGLSSRGESPTLVGDSETGTTPYSENGDLKSPSLVRGGQKEETLAESIRALRRSNAEKDISINQLTENYNQLEDQHRDTVKYLDELKDEAQKAPSPQTPASTTALSAPPSLNRRRSNLGKDREERVFANLQNMLIEHLHSNPEAMKDAENALSSAMAESKIRHERVDALEGEVANQKETIKSNMNIIKGLSSERNRGSATVTDVSLSNTIKEHLMQTQRYLAGLQESNREHQDRLTSSVKAFAARLAENPDTEATTPPSSTSKERDDASAGTGSANGDGGFGLANESVDPDAQGHSPNLLTDLALFESRHRSNYEAVQALEQQLLLTISGLESSIKNAEAISSESVAAKDLRSSVTPSQPPSDWEPEKAKLLKQVQELEGERAAGHSKIRDYAEKVQRLEKEFEQIMQERIDMESRKHVDLIANLESQMDHQKSLTLFHQQGEESKSRELNELRSTQDKAQNQHGKHQDSMSALQQELTRAHMENASLMQSVCVALEEETDPADLQARLQTFADERKSLTTKHSAAAEALGSAQKETNELKAKVNEMTAANEELLYQLDSATEDKHKKGKMVQDLEDQLNKHFELNRSAENRVSTVQKERNQMEKDLADTRSRAVLLENQISEMKRFTDTSRHSGQESAEGERRSSNASAIRKSASQASIRNSPAPQVPLPPLPSFPDVPTSPRPTTPKTSPPPSRHTSRDVSLAQQQQDSQIAVMTARLEKLEKKLNAEKTLNQTLEEALVDLETTHNQTKKDIKDHVKRAKDAEAENQRLTSDKKNMRNSIQQLQDETVRRKTAEEARKQLEERMEALAPGKKKKKGTLNCF